ncbi:DUF1627 domain-containing protein [Citrobacter braakii]|nr:DUF1627 domain-containing protein [Citrobacter braakii]
METVLKALESMGKASSIELAARLGMERQQVINELWELQKAGVVTKNSMSWSLSGCPDQKDEDVGEMSASKVTEQHLLGAIEERGPLTADELAALFSVTSRKVVSTLAMATKKSRVHRVAKDGLFRYCFPNQHVVEMLDHQEAGKSEPQQEAAKLPAPEITAKAGAEDIAEVVKLIPSFTEKRADDLIFPSLRMANRELRRAKNQVQKWERVCAALRALNKHRDIIAKIHQEAVQ